MLICPFSLVMAVALAAWASSLTRNWNKQSLDGARQSAEAIGQFGFHLGDTGPSSPIRPAAGKAGCAAPARR